MQYLRGMKTIGGALVIIFITANLYGQSEGEFKSSIGKVFSSWEKRVEAAFDKVGDVKQVDVHMNDQEIKEIARAYNKFYGPQKMIAEAEVFTRARAFLEFGLEARLENEMAQPSRDWAYLGRGTSADVGVSLQREFMREENPDEINRINRESNDRVQDLFNKSNSSKTATDSMMRSFQPSIDAGIRNSSIKEISAKQVTNEINGNLDKLKASEQERRKAQEQSDMKNPNVDKAKLFDEINKIGAHKKDEIQNSASEKSPGSAKTLQSQPSHSNQNTNSPTGPTKCLTCGDQ